MRLLGGCLLLRACAALWICTLAGCLSIGTVEGYYPRSDASARAGALSARDDETWELPLPAGASLLVRASHGQVHPAPLDQILLEFALLVPSGVTVRVLGSEVRVTSSGWSEGPGTRTVRIVCIENWTSTDAATRVHPSDALLVGTPGTRTAPGFGLSFAREGLRSRTCLPHTDEFELQLPALLVDGELFTPSPLRFSAFEEFRVSIPRD